MLRASPLPSSTRSGLRRSLATCVALLVSGLVVPLFAQESKEAMERRVQDIIRTTMSPFCPGRTLDSCPSPKAADWRDDVRGWVAEGVSTEEIRQRLTQRFPEFDLTGAPSTALDAVLPIVLTIVAVALLFLLLRALLGRRRAAEENATPEPGGSDAERRLDEELARLDE
jgi:cytochrome c-type biogenesis protein CcmH/NrfF